MLPYNGYAGSLYEPQQRLMMLASIRRVAKEADRVFRLVSEIVDFQAIVFFQWENKVH
jgi:hypothetical protein